MSSGLAVDGKRKEEQRDKHGLFARETPGIRTNTSLGYGHHTVESYDIKSNDTTYIVSDNRTPELETSHHEPNLIKPSTSYVLTRAGHLESNVDHWMGNDPEHQEETRQQRRESTAGVQHSSISPQSSGTYATLWYLLTLLPVVSFHRRCWRDGWCSPRTSIMTMLNIVDQFASYVKQVVARMRVQVAELAFEQILHECFAVGMEVVLMLHALIFLVLSLFQASAISGMD